MNRKRARLCMVAGLLLLSILACPSAAYADGGIITADPDVWEALEEGNQIAVVRLGEGDTAQVDLFVSLLDTSKESHEVVFFVPLGVRPSDFGATEEFLDDFEDGHTRDFDSRLFEAAMDEWEYRQDVRQALLPGFVLSHGIWLAPCLCLMTSCSPADSLPADTFETEHSTIELYDIDAETDLEALAGTAGLDPSVQETLRNLEGQQIAVVTLMTQPMGGAGTGSGGDRYGDPFDPLGLHLTWTAGLVSGEEGGTYAYPLGTGGAWAHPIGLTRIYISAPPGVDFTVTYPQVGENRSGYSSGVIGYPRRHIDYYSSEPSFAVDQAVDLSGRIWRATYVQSNAVEDIVVTRVDGTLPETSAAYRRQATRDWLMLLTWPIGLLVAAVLWVIAWRMEMSHRLGFSYSNWFDPQLWKQAGKWLGIHFLSNAVPLLPMLGVLSGRDPWVDLGSSLTLAMSPLLLIASFGVVSGVLFARDVSRREDIPNRKAIGAYATVALMSAIGYWMFSIVYLAVVGGF